MTPRYFVFGRRARTPLAERAVIRSNSKNRSHAPGTRKPNKLGLWDIYGNVAEIVLPIAPTAMQHAVIVRGGSFKSSEQQCFRRIEYLPYQSIPYDIGFRPVIAPGDMEYFDRHFFLSGAMQTRLKGKIYEIIGGNVKAFNWRKAYNTAKLLGGDIVEFEDKSHLDSLLEKLPLAASNWGCFIGAHKVNGQWIWIRRQQKIDFGIWCRGIPTTMEKHFVFLKHRHWHAVAANRHPIFICEWDETKFHSRNDQLKSGQRLPGEICRFTAGNRQFMLINCSTIWHSAKRICELLGGRIACLDTPELRKEVIKKLKNFSRHKIMLGGYAKRDKWYWLSGKTIGIDLVPDPDMQIPSANRNFVILKNGTFFNGQFGQLLLCEWQTDFKNRSSN